MPRAEARHSIPLYLFCPSPGYKYTLPAILDKMMKELHAAPLSVDPIYLIY